MKRTRHAKRENARAKSILRLPDLEASKSVVLNSLSCPDARVVVHRIIAVGEYVWAHVNFLNLFKDDPQDTGIAGVDIYKLDAEGKAIEHWDTLQLVGDARDSAPLVAPNIPRANPNGTF
jgi:hypothetical protein